MGVDEVECLEEGGTEPTIALLRRLAAALDSDVRLTPGHDLGSVWVKGGQETGCALVPAGPGVVARYAAGRAACATMKRKRPQAATVSHPGRDAWAR